MRGQNWQKEKRGKGHADVSSEGKEAGKGERAMTWLFIR